LIRVVIADDSPDIRDGLSSPIDGQFDFVVVGTAGDRLEAVEKAKDHRPDNSFENFLSRWSSPLPDAHFK